VLSNGVKVVLKPTKFKDDEILMDGLSWGGYSVLNPNDAPTIKALDDLYTIGGVGNFSAIELPKMLSGKKVSVNPSISRLVDQINGNCTPKDFETMMQLTYLYFTQPRVDEDAFLSYCQRTKSQLEAQEVHPMMTIQDTICHYVYGDFPTAMRMKATDIDKIDYKKAMEIYKEHFGSIENFTFTFVGNFDIETIRPYIQLYLGGIKPGKQKTAWKDDKLQILNNNVVCHYDKPMATPTATVLLLYSGKMKYTTENRLKISALAGILNIVYTETIREDEGGSYGVNAAGQVSKYPLENFSLQIIFQTNPDVYQKMLDIAKTEVENLVNQGPREIDVNKVKENLLKKFTENQEENRYWLSVINDYNLFKINTLKDYKEMVDKLSVTSLQEFAKQHIKNAYLKEIVQNSNR
jgi:zinc protease